LTLVLSFSLLTLNHLLEGVVFNLFLMLLQMKEVFLLLLLVFEVVHISSDFVFKLLLSLIDILFYLFFELKALHASEGFLLFFLALSLCALSGDFHITLASLKDISSALFGFIEFFPCLNYRK
jgi:hypothetical protein